MAIEDGLASEDGIVAAQAEDTVLRAGPAAVPSLTESLLKTSGRLRRRRAADLLGQIGDPRAIAPLALALRTARLEDEALTLAIAHALCRLGSKDGIWQLIRLLESGDRPMRLRALVVLRRYTHKSFGYEYDGSGSERAAAVERWQEWWRGVRDTFQLVRPPAP